MFLREYEPEIVLSFVIPAHNEAENLPTLIREIVEAAADLDRTFEILVIDDHSSDRTSEALAEISEVVPQLVTRRLTRQSGQSAALSAGFDLAQGEILITLDADLQNDPADIPRLLDALDGVDMAIGWRRDRKDTFAKRIISKFANAVRNWATNENVRDTGCGLKAFRRECVSMMPRFDGMHRFLPTLAKMAGHTVDQIPVHHRPRTRGKTHYNLLNRSVRPILDLLAIRWLQRRAIHPVFEREHELVHF